MRSKLHNQLNTKLDLVVSTYAQQFNEMETFPSYNGIPEWANGKEQYGKQ
jgi:hypothetical protein